MMSEEEKRLGMRPADSFDLEVADLMNEQPPMSELGKMIRNEVTQQLGFFSREMGGLKQSIVDLSREAHKVWRETEERKVGERCDDRLTLEAAKGKLEHFRGLIIEKDEELANKETQVERLQGLAAEQADTIERLKSKIDTLRCVPGVMHKAGLATMYGILDLEEAQKEAEEAPLSPSSCSSVLQAGRSWPSSSCSCSVTRSMPR